MREKIYEAGKTVMVLIVDEVKHFYIKNKSMYKNTIYILFILLFVSGCKLISVMNTVSEEEFIAHGNVPQTFELEDSKIILNVNLNGHNYDMFFDTRAADVLFPDKVDTNIFTRLNTPKIMGNPKVATGERIKGGIVKIQTAQCNLFTAKNWTLSAIEGLKLNCINIAGLIGHESFSIGYKKDRQILKIDFDKQEIMLIDKVPEEWIKIKSKFKLGYTKIFLTINGIEYSFGFDTGFNGQIIFSKKRKSSQIAELESKTILYGNMFQVAGGGIVSDTIEIKNAKKVFLNDAIFVENSDIIFTDKITGNLVGIEFMKNYNWIIDYKEKEIYIQQRKTDIPEEKVSYSLKYLGVTFELNTDSTTVNSLTISGRAEKAGLNIGDEILSINDVDISKIPICERDDEVQKILENSNENIFTIRRDDKIKKITLSSN